MVILYSKDNCKNLQDHKRVESYKTFPIYRDINGQFKCDTDVFIATANNIEDVKEKIDKLLCDKKLLMPLGLYTEEAAILDEEVHKIASDVVERWMNKGYSVNDIESIFTKAVSVVCIEKRMRRTYNIKKGKYKNS